MGTFSGPHVPRVSLGISALKPGLEALARSWRWLSTSLSDPYRPELHYMRGLARNTERNFRVSEEAGSHTIP